MNFIMVFHEGDWGIFMMWEKLYKDSFVSIFLATFIQYMFLYTAFIACYFTLLHF